MVHVKLPMLNYLLLSHHPQQRHQALVPSPKRPITEARLAVAMKAAPIRMMAVGAAGRMREMMIWTEEQMTTARLRPAPTLIAVVTQHMTPKAIEACSSLAGTMLAAMHTV